MNEVNKHGYIVKKSESYEKLKTLTKKERLKRIKIRKDKIITACVIGIIVCIVFALIKFSIGRITNSLAIESDAVSSLTESYSSIVAAVGIWLAHKRPNKRFPNGFGRIEFLTAIIGGVFVIITGWHYFENSWTRIQTPQVSLVNGTQLFIIFVTILGKFFLFLYDRKIGKEYGSSGLITASRSAMLSCFSSLLVIVSSIIYQYFRFNIDGYVGLIISVGMLLTGFVGILNGIYPLLGKPVDPETFNYIEEILLDKDPIVGVYDLRVLNNGAGIMRGTVNVEVPIAASADEIYNAFRDARTEIYRKLGIEITIGLLTVNYCSDEVFPVFNLVFDQLIRMDGIQNIHGFRWDKQANEVDLHVIIDFDYLNDEELDRKIRRAVQEVCPNTDVLVDYNVNYIKDNPKQYHPVCNIRSLNDESVPD